MASFNRVILVGNVTREIDLRHIPSGTAVCDVGLAVNRRVKKGDEWTDEVSFIECTCWGRTAEVANEYLSKGSQVLFEGELDQQTWEEEGKNRSKIKVIVDKMQLLGTKGDRQQGSQQQAAPEQPAAGRSYVPDGGDIPF